MTDKHEAINDLRAVYERESKELKELTGYFQKVKKKNEKWCFMDCMDHLSVWYVICYVFMYHVMSYVTYHAYVNDAI